MHTNAIETWLARMHRHARATGVKTDWWFHVQFPEPGLLEQDDAELAGRVIRSPSTLSHGARFFGAFRKLCQAERFDVVHVHADLMAAPYVLAARSAGPARTVVHVHNADEQLPTPSLLKRSLLTEPFRRVGLSANRVVGISNHTLDTFLAGRPRRPGRDLVHYYGVDPTPFAKASLNRAQFRRELGLRATDRIMLFAGRLVPEKNPLFAVEVLAAIRRRDPTIFGVFAGSGSMEPEIRAHAQQLGVSEAIRLLGWRSDVAQVMRCCDGFILPRPERPKEGLGLAVVEAQLAGLRMLLSLGISDDALLPSASYRRLPLSAGAEAWAEAGLELLASEAPDRAAALRDLAASPMDMDRALADMIRIHE